MVQLGRKGYTVFTVIWVIIVFLIVWFLWLGGWLNDSAQAAINQHSLTGLSAFLLANMNLWVFMAVIIFGLIGIAFGGDTA